MEELLSFAEVPTPAPIQWLEADEDWTAAPQLGLLAKIFSQDCHNLNKVQQGLKNLASQRVVLADYQETKLRHFHELLQHRLEVDYNEMLNGDQAENPSPQRRDTEVLTGDLN